VSNTLHAQCISQLLFAPFFWFLETPVGRITSRFSSDLAAVDLYLSFWIDNLFQLGSVLVIFTITVMVLVPPVIAVIAVCGPFFAMVVDGVDRCNREMKRMSNAAMGPVLSNVQVGRWTCACVCVCVCRGKGGFSVSHSWQPMRPDVCPLP
jgi:ABC-type multidrug transport system fused ATPase/permease subunit